MRVIVGIAMMCFYVCSALAADPKIEAALKTFKATSTDANKLKTFCAMTKAMDAAGDKPSPQQEARIDALMKALGADFENAWNAVEGPDDKSPDVKAFYAGVDELVAKCPK